MLPGPTIRARVRFAIVRKYLSLKEFGEIHGLTPETVRSYFKDGRLPEPDAVIGGGQLRGSLPRLPERNAEPGSRSDARYGWLPETAHNWERPGAGARTDLRQ